MTSNDMIERVARAIQQSFKDRIAEPLRMPFEETGVLEPSMVVMREYARAAIEAMREPTEAMLKSGFRKNVFDNRGGCPGVPKGTPCDDWSDSEAISKYMQQSGICRVARMTRGTCDVWQAMISAALHPIQNGEGE